tara:strand:- start:1257 stop:1565 length:309 start_codon:yes stop_codon:yes gene_type:complete
MQKAVHSTKISEKFFFEDDKLIIKKTFDASHMLNDVKHAREVTENSFGSDYKHIGNVDFGELGKWLKEAGVSWDDTEAMKEVIKRNMLSNEFSALRVWEGTY